MTIVERKRILRRRRGQAERMRCLPGSTPHAVILGLCPEDLPRVQSARGERWAQALFLTALSPNLRFRKREPR